MLRQARASRPVARLPAIIFGAGESGVSEFGTGSRLQKGQLLISVVLRAGLKTPLPYDSGASSQSLVVSFSASVFVMAAPPDKRLGPPPDRW